MLTKHDTLDNISVKQDLAVTMQSLRTATEVLPLNVTMLLLLFDSKTEQREKHRAWVQTESHEG